MNVHEWDDYAITPTRFEQRAAELFSSTKKWIKEDSINYAKDHLSQLVLIGSVAVLALGGPLSSSMSAAWRGIGGDWLGIGVVAGGAFGKVAYKIGNSVLGPWMPKPDSLPSIGQLANDLLVNRLVPNAPMGTDMARLLSDPSLAAFAPRLVGLHELSMPGLLRVLPHEARRVLLRKLLGVTDAEVGKVGLDRAILKHLVSSDKVDQIGTLSALMHSPDLERLAPRLTEYTSQDVLNLLSESPRLRADLTMQMLSIRERLFIMNRWGHYLATNPELIERKALHILCPKLKNPMPLHRLLVRADLKQIAPRLYGLDRNDWSWDSVRTLLSPDEFLADFPTLGQLKGTPAGFLALFMTWSCIETAMHGDTIPAGVGDDGPTQMVMMMAPFAIKGLDTLKEYLWPEPQQPQQSAGNSQQEAQRQQLQQQLRQLQELLAKTQNDRAQNPASPVPASSEGPSA